MEVPITRSEPQKIFRNLSGYRISPSLAFGIILIAALCAFEVFNYSTTDYALGDVLGGLTFAGVRWSTILALAFCGIDFAGIARLFSPDQKSRAANEVWYLFGAWLLAATMNAILTWWGVSMAMLNHSVQSTAVIDNAMLLKVVPVFVAVMVWLIRILIIGSLSYAGENMFTGQPAVYKPVDHKRVNLPMARPSAGGTHAERIIPNPAQAASSQRPVMASMAHPAVEGSRNTPAAGKPELTYQNLGASSNRPNNMAGARR